MNFKKSESGRSMVEMLGVLAIIGVLSVGGIAGYSLSMRRHRANTIMDLMSKYALLVYNICQQDLLEKNQTGNHSWFCIGLSEKTQFQNTGIGNLPAGVNSVFYGGVKTNEKTGIDEVHITITFTDEKLCQAAASITGTGCNSQALNLSIKQN